DPPARSPGYVGLTTGAWDKRTGPGSPVVRYRSTHPRPVNAIRTTSPFGHCETPARSGRRVLRGACVPAPCRSGLICRVGKGIARMDQIIVDRQIRRRRTRRRGIVALLGAVSLLTIGAGSISLAQFTDNSGA